MTPEEEGRWAAAQGTSVEDCPYIPSPARDEWFVGYVKASESTRSQRDAFDHPPHFPPRLCARDVTKVCICCDACQRACRAQTAHEIGAQPIPWERVLWALPRLATAVELMITRDHVDRGGPCTVCGGSLMQHGRCATCGKPYPPLPNDDDDE